MHCEGPIAIEGKQMLFHNSNLNNVIMLGTLEQGAQQHTMNKTCMDPMSRYKNKTMTLFGK